MATRKVVIGGLMASLNADAKGASLNIALGGSLWKRIFRLLKGKRDTEDLSASGVVGSTTGTGSVSGQPAATGMDEIQDLSKQVASTYWYHTFDFGNGIKTPGQFDHAPILHCYKLPESLAGKRVLDVATFDGFWAFEFEKRGASEVVALDVAKPSDCDFPPQRRASATGEEMAATFGKGFAIAHEQFNSRVQRVFCNVYDLTPEVAGTFDIVHTGDFLVHLNSPVKALQRIAGVVTGYALISEVYFPALDALGFRHYAEYLGGQEDVTWWKLGKNTLKQMVLDAGFSRVEEVADFSYGPTGMPNTMHHVVLKAIK